MSVIDRVRRAGPGSTVRGTCRILGLMTAVILGGCAFLKPSDEPTRYYVLVSPHRAGERSDGVELRQWRIGLKPVEVPGYLRGRAMAVRTGASEVRYAESDRWAESLPGGISRVLGEAVGAARNVGSVTFRPQPEGSLDYEVTIRVLSCEGVQGEGDGRAGSIRFATTWEIRAAGANSPGTGLGGFTNGPASWDGKDYGQLAQRLGDAIAVAGEALAACFPRVEKSSLDAPRK